MKTLLTLITTLCAFAASGQTIWQINNTTNSPDSLRTAFSKVNSNSVVISNFMATVSGTTNAIIRSGSYAQWSTEEFLTTNTVLRMLPGTFTNPASMTYTVAAGSTSPWWRFSGGDTNWSSGLPLTTGIVEIAFFDSDMSIGAPINPVISNLTVFCLERPDLFGTTNRLAGQTFEVDPPTTDAHAANKGYVDAAVSAVNYVRNGGIVLSGTALNLNSEWVWIADTNSAALRWLGSDVLRVENPESEFATITGIAITNGIVWVNVWTNGVTAAPVPQWTYDITYPTWAVCDLYTNSFPTVSGTNYQISFPLPNTTKAFIRVGKATVQSATLTVTGDLVVTGSISATGSGLTGIGTNNVVVAEFAALSGTPAGGPKTNGLALLTAPEVAFSSTALIPSVQRLEGSWEQAHFVGVDSIDGYKTNIVQFFIMTTNTGPQTVFGAFTPIIPGEAPRCTETSRAITVGTLNTTNVSVVSFTNTTASAWSGTGCQNVRLMPNGTMVSSNVWWVVGARSILLP